MKAILTLSGYGDRKIRTMSFIDRMLELSEKDRPNVIYLPTAGFDNFKTTDEGYEDFLERGCKVTVLKLSEYEKGSEELAQIVADAGIIYADGGNLMRLMNEFQRTGADELFKQAYENGAVLAGMSSGAMCWHDRGYDSCGLDGSYMFVKCTGTLPLPFCFCPHFNGGTWYTFAEAVKQQKLPGIACEDGAAIEYSNGSFKVVKEMNDRNAYLFHPANGYAKQNITSDDMLNELFNKEN